MSIEKIQKSFLAAICIFLLTSFTNNEGSKEGEDSNNKAKEKEVIQDSSILPLKFTDNIFHNKQSEGDSGSQNEENKDDNVSTLSFNFIHYVLFKFKMNDIL